MSLAQMKRIRQKDGTGCGIACVAMVVGESYATVMKVARDIFQWEKDKRSFYTTSSQLRNLLLAFELQSQRGRSVRHLLSLPDLAIVGINHNRKTNNWHWVVFRREPDHEYVLDPLSKHIYRSSLSRIRLHSCIPIE